MKKKRKYGGGLWSKSEGEMNGWVEVIRCLDSENVCVAIIG